MFLGSMSEGVLCFMYGSKRTVMHLDFFDSTKYSLAEMNQPYG